MTIPRACRSLLLALGIVVSALVAPGASADAPDALESAPVPAMCGHDASQLTDGELASASDDEADVTLRTVARGVLQKGRKAGYAAVFSCTYPDGHDGPNQLVFYTTALGILGQTDLGELTDSDQPTVRGISIANREVSVQVVGINADDEEATAGTRSALVGGEWSTVTKQMSVQVLTEFTELPQAKKLNGQLVRHSASGVAKYLSPDDAKVALHAARKGNKVLLRECIGPLSDDWFWVENDGESDLPQRACLWDVITPGEHGYEFTMVVGYDHKTWRTWRATYATTVA
jgi:hypothetical protein